MIKFIACKILNLHRVKITAHDGFSFYGDCERCKERCLQDSQGNWFVVSRTRP